MMDFAGGIYWKIKLEHFSITHQIFYNIEFQHSTIAIFYVTIKLHENKIGV